MSRKRLKAVEPEDEGPAEILASGPGCELNCRRCTLRCSVIQACHEGNGERLADALAAYRENPSHGNEKALLETMDSFNTGARVAAEYREKRFGRPIKTLPMPNAGMMSLAVH